MASTHKKASVKKPRLSKGTALAERTRASANLLTDEEREALDGGVKLFL
jgi:hypothetical protein